MDWTKSLFTEINTGEREEVAFDEDELVNISL